MKKILSLALCIALILALSACGKEPDVVASPQNPSDISSKPVDAAEEPETAPEPELTEAQKLVARAAEMQDYSHAEGEDAAPITTVDDNILLLVNKTHPLAKDYKADDLVSIENCDASIGTAETHQMRAVAASALAELQAGAKEAGYDLVLRTGYRSYSYQENLYSSYVQNHGEAEAARYSAKPGESEHQTGLCCDVGIIGVGLTAFNGTEEAAWVAENGHNYGFILRYPEGKESITGYMYESWHIRYVGVDVATEIYNQQTTLEEYLGITD